MRALSIPGKSLLDHRAKIAGIALLCAAFGAEALTLGRVRGAALVGQPLNMVVPVQMDAGEDAASLCFEADVFHADTRQDGSRVRVLVEATAQAQAANVRILSSAVIDEPVVTVYLRTGCGQKTTRRYVLLADMPSDIATPAAPAAPLIVPVTALTPVPANVTSVAPVSSGLASAVFRSAPDAAASAVRAKKVGVPKQAVQQQTANPRPGEKNKPGRSAGQPRLKLDPLEFLSDRVANLESPAPVTAPEDTLRNIQRMQTLEGSLKTLLASAAKNEATLADLKVRLQKAESQRFPAAVIYALIALVLACLAALAWLWNRQRGLIQSGTSEWWGDSIKTPEPAAPEPAARPEPVPARTETETETETGHFSKKTEPAALATLAQDAAPASAVDVNLLDMSDSYFDDLMLSGAADSAPHQQAQPMPPVPMPALPGGLAGELDCGAVLDLRQQAEFFVSLGQTDQAVRILERQIHESVQPNPFVYLDLLNIFHALGLRNDFQQFREDFMLLFHAQVPEFEAFRDEGLGLESYPDLLFRITALWSTPKVLALIEACIFVDPREGKVQYFDLAAFRDLLLLHAVAHGVGAAPAATSLASPASYFSDFGTKAAENSTLPGPMNGVPANDSDAEIELPGMLDLDLSESEMARFTDHSESVAHIDLPLLMPDAGGADVQEGDASSSSYSGNLIDFDLPEAREASASSGPKPGQVSGRH